MTELREAKQNKTTHTTNEERLLYSMVKWSGKERRGEKIGLEVALA